MLNASGKSPANVAGWHIVAAFDDSLPDATDRFARIGNLDKMQLDHVTLLFCALENAHVGSTAQRRFEGKCFMSIYQFAKLAQ